MCHSKLNHLLLSHFPSKIVFIIPYLQFYLQLQSILFCTISNNNTARTRFAVRRKCFTLHRIIKMEFHEYKTPWQSNSVNIFFKCRIPSEWIRSELFIAACNNNSQQCERIENNVYTLEI